MSEAPSESGAAGEPPRPGYQRVESSIEADAPVDVVWVVVGDSEHHPEAIEWVAEVTMDGD